MKQEGLGIFSGAHAVTSSHKKTTGHLAQLLGIEFLLDRVGVLCHQPCLVSIQTIGLKKIFQQKPRLESFKNSCPPNLLRFYALVRCTWIGWLVAITRLLQELPIQCPVNFLEVGWRSTLPVT